MPKGGGDALSGPVVRSYDLLVDAGDVIGPLADEMRVWVRGRIVPTGNGSTPTDLAEVQVWVAEADADRAGRILEEPVEEPAPPLTQKRRPPPATWDDFPVTLLRFVVPFTIIWLAGAAYRHCG